MSRWSAAVGGGLAAPTPNPPGESGGEVRNPFDGVTPDMRILGEAFGNTWIQVAGAAWALMIMGAGLWLGFGFLKMSQAKQLGNSHIMSEATGDVKIRGAALGGLVALPVIVGAIITVFG